MGKQSEKPSLHHDGRHRFAIKAVGETEDDRLQNDTDGFAAGPRSELPCQITAKDELFREAR